MFRVIRNIPSMRVKFPRTCTLPQMNIKHVLGGIVPVRRSVSTCKPGNIYLIDEDDSSSAEVGSDINKYTLRTHTCGELRIDNVAQTVVLSGWLEYRRMNKFIMLRDSYGETQLLIGDEDKEKQRLLESIPLESIIKVTGTVLARPDNMRNKQQPTGDIEVLVDKLTLLNKARENLPFNIREFQKAKEARRMQYRYLDLRFAFMQHNLRVRSAIIMKMREFLVNNCGFVDVETPTLFKATPGGAQEFVVPTRFPELFYSLVQSPQQFKQMLMAGAIDRYFQIARCYRDEGSRSDRQPEFTQLDIEMSFTSLDNILQLVENLLQHSWPSFLNPLPKRFQRISFRDALELYGSDQPDVRCDFKLQNCTDVIKANSKLISTDHFGAYCIVFPREYADLSKTIEVKLTELSKQYAQVKFVQSKVKTPKEFIRKIEKLLTEPVAAQLSTLVNLSDENLLFLTYGNKKQAQQLLGKVRIEYIEYLESLGLTVRKSGMHLVWIVDMPLFEIGEDPGKFSSAHHPFTSPNSADIHLLETSPLEVRALSFDLVLNGNEVGGGSVRIHDPNLQEKIFDLLNIEKSSMKHLLDMLSSGCPPHGGIALGLDRLLSKIMKTTSIRDVIAFPKTFEGRDPLSGAPSRISEATQKLYNIKTVNRSE